MAAINYPKTRKAHLAKSIIERLSKEGFLAYLAGGSVRDMLVERVPKDYDIVTSAKPEDIERLFPRTVPIGRKFGIITVIERRIPFEVATFRGESAYEDRRRPQTVFWTNPEQDAKRRDLTINALFFDPLDNKIIDYVDGLLDIENKIIRFVGNPDERVQEDALRLLRAVRLKNHLGFQYDSETYQALKTNAALIQAISVERIREELDRMWLSPSRAEALAELYELGLLQEILPEVAALRGVPQPLEYHREGDVFDHTLQAVASLPKRSPNFLTWAVLLHDVGKAQTLAYPTQPGGRIRFDNHRTVGAAIARQIGVRLKMPRIEIQTIAWMVDHHMNLIGIDDMREAKRRAYLLDPRFRWLLELHHADAAGTIPRDLSLYRELKAFYHKYLALWREHQAIGTPKALLTGHDLQNELSLKPGPELGRLLAAVHEAQLERIISTRAEAIEFAKKQIK